MKAVLLLIFFSVITTATGYTQTLDGLWTGYYYYDRAPSSNSNFISMTISYNADSSLKISTYTSDAYLDSNRVNEMGASAKCIFLINDSLCIEETNVTLARGDTVRCFQQYRFKINRKKKGAVLKGRWKFISNDGICKGESGKIILRKQKGPLNAIWIRRN